MPNNNGSGSQEGNFLSPMAQRTLGGVFIMAGVTGAIFSKSNAVGLASSLAVGVGDYLTTGTQARYQDQSPTGHEVNAGLATATVLLGGRVMAQGQHPIAGALLTTVAAVDRIRTQNEIYSTIEERDRQERIPYMRADRIPGDTGQPTRDRSRSR